ncbi:hypothetical protein GF351_04820 [Candidatus Woesearchaeota archaeon]|nr:hypothetical protein [Candidatus Woesearchaeota archaeon]
MVLEQLYPLTLLEKNPLYAFLLGVGYSVIGIGSAVLLFPEDPALVAVAFIAIMILPTLNKLIRQEEEIESLKKDFGILLFFRDHKYIFYIYAFFFVGVLIGFGLFSLILPNLATNVLFRNQLEVLYGSVGHAHFSLPLFWDILSNNLGVLILVFVAAFIFGDGGIFLITWNASVWGTIFGNLAKNAALGAGKSPFVYFGLVLLSVFPHMILEAFSYFSAASAGAVVSKAVIREKFFSYRFYTIFVNTLILLFFAFFVLLVAVAVETYVLNNLDIYRTIVAQAF